MVERRPPLATPGLDSLAVVWDAEAGEASRVIRRPSPITALAFAPDATHLALSSEETSAWAMSGTHTPSTMSRSRSRARLMRS